jgi:pimeloyl-ACP methyl ester carboxylesterase
MGGASGRAMRHPDDYILTELGLRLFTLERPGFGLSDYQPNRTLLGWADDVAQLADALNLSRFAIIGTSQGGPYAMACTFCLPERLSVLTLVSAVAPLDVPGVSAGMNPNIARMTMLAKRVPFLLTLMFNTMGRMAKRNPERLLEQTFNSLPDTDKGILDTADPRTRAIFGEGMQQAFAGGGRASTTDMRLVVLPWGFRVEDLRLKNIYLWQGEADPNVPPVMGRYLASAIPNCQPTFVPGAGHFLLYSHWRAILEQLRKTV